MIRLSMLSSAIVIVGLAGAMPTSAHAATNVLYLNRCVGDCVVTQGPDDARANLSSIPTTPGQHTLTEFGWGDAQWDALVQCVREVYSPYDIEITDVEPSPNVMYNEQMVAGLGGQLGRSDAGGISPGTPCGAPVNNTITFTFANGYGGSGKRQVDALCRVVAQESGHSYGLDHAFKFIDNMSACKDPMSYVEDCGGQRFFRNIGAKCGEFAERPCHCQEPQNSHVILLAQLGTGTPITRPPEVAIAVPVPGTTTIANGERVVARASAQRGVAFVDLKLNGYVWVTLPGVAFGSEGQPEGQYSMQLPADVPDGVIDIEVVARDDLNVSTTTAKLQVTKGAPCTTADSCATGQICEAGRCFWETPTGSLGDACAYPQFCKAGLTCEGATETDEVCTQPCVLGVADSCPTGLTCATAAMGGARCLPGGAAEGGGCCSTGGDAAAQSALLALALAFLARRRRRA